MMVDVCVCVAYFQIGFVALATANFNSFNVVNILICTFSQIQLQI